MFIIKKAFRFPKKLVEFFWFFAAEGEELGLDILWQGMTSYESSLVRSVIDSANKSADKLFWENYYKNELVSVSIYS